MPYKSLLSVMVLITDSFLLRIIPCVYLRHMLLRFEKPKRPATSEGHRPFSQCAINTQLR